MFLNIDTLLSLIRRKENTAGDYHQTEPYQDEDPDIPGKGYSAGFAIKLKEVHAENSLEGDVSIDENDELQALGEGCLQQRSYRADRSRTLP